MSTFKYFMKNVLR